MNAISQLGELYNLSPATVAGLADATGAKPSPGIFGGAVAGAPGVPIQGAGTTLAPGMPDPNVQPMRANEPPSPAPPPPKAPETVIQGPAHDDFPTVRASYANAEGAGQSAPASPSVAIPAHWQPGSHSVALQHGMAPDEHAPGMAARDVAMGHELLSADKRLQAAQQRGEADAVYAAAHQEAARVANERVAQLNRDRDDYIAREGKKLEQMSAATQREVDPEAFWKERGSGAKIAAALMMALNQFAVMWRGQGTNVAKEIIDSAVDQNIKAQQANIANSSRALDQRQNIYARNLAAFGDQERAILATKMQYLDQIAAQADGIKARAGSADAEAAHQDLIAKLFQERAGYADQFAKLTHTQASEQMNESFKPAAVVGGGAGGQKGKEGLYVPTLGGYARDDASAKKLNEKGALRMQITENMRTVNGLMQEAKGLSSASPNGYMRLKQIDDQIQSLVNDSLTKNTVLEGQGAMSAGDKEVAAIAKGLSGVSVQWKPNTFIEKRQENIKKAATNMLEQHRLEGEAYGIQKGTEQYVQGLNGPEPVRKLEGRNARPSKNTQAYDDLVSPPKGVAQKREE